MQLRRVVSNTTSLVGNLASANGPTSRNMSVTQKGVLATADNNTVHGTRASMSLSGTATAGNQVSNITGNHAHPGAGMPSPTGNGMANEAVPHAWHRVHLRRFVDSVSGARLVLVQQSDVSEEREAQAAMAELLEHEHKALESIFPRHVIEFLTLQGPEHPALQGIPSNIMKESDLDKVGCFTQLHDQPGIVDDVYDI